MSEQPSDDRKRRRRRRGRRRGARPSAAAAASDTVSASTAEPSAPRSDAPADVEMARDGGASAARKARSRRRRKGPRRGSRRGGAPEVVATERSPEASLAMNAAAEDAPVTSASLDAKTRAAAEESAASSDVSPARSARAAARDRATLETSAGGIVYRVQDGEPFFLLIRDSYRNWGFPKGHLEDGEAPEQAAVREVEEETGLGALRVDGAIETIDWFFRFRGKLVHKVCHFYLMRTHHRRTNPQRDEGITACRWVRFEDATKLISYANARAVLVRAHEMVQADAVRHTRRVSRAPADEVAGG